jgi:hypothetical protein
MKNKFLYIKIIFLIIIIYSLLISCNKTESNNEVVIEDTDISVTDEISYSITNTRLDYVELDNKEYYGIVEITNTGNNNIYLKDCTFDLKNNNGEYFQTSGIITSCPSVIRPNEKGYFYNDIGNLKLTEDALNNESLILVPHVNIVAATQQVNEFEVSNTDLKYRNKAPIVTGKISNNKNKEQSVCIRVVFYDEDGEAIAISDTTITIPKNCKRPFEIKGFYIKNRVEQDIISNYKVFAQGDYFQ